MNMAGNVLQQLLILLLFSHLISLNSGSSSNTKNLFHHDQDMLSSYQKQATSVHRNSRQDLEYNDYSESGPNERHIPKSPAEGN
ncbi:hypothetical protein K2173_021939 [Erythroxylum novogranatense]|uniref:Uncharacterized protein n=1 Tax=Erythroxylum novogranatense TaxID=1862640 RepID=A0AAV8T2B6_9ROSI|nr:hypothetical protein K2173_021939 [Erythroxylum novogranatense]